MVHAFPLEHPNEALAGRVVGAVPDRAHAADQRVATEELLGSGCLHTIFIDRSMVDGVVEIPFGAHPTSCVPSYGIDLEHLKAYSAAVGENEWRAYRERYVDLTHDAYVAVVGGADRIRAIPAPVF